MRISLPLTFLAAIALAACGGGTAPTATSAPTGGGTSTPAPTTSATTGGGGGTADDIECATGSGGTAVSIVDFAFEPAAATADGGVVTWTNNGDADHTVTFDNGKDCLTVSSGASLSVTFNAPGSYPYHCDIHKSMKGTITVSG